MFVLSRLNSRRGWSCLFIGWSEAPTKDVIRLRHRTVTTSVRRGSIADQGQARLCYFCLLPWNNQKTKLVIANGGHRWQTAERAWCGRPATVTMEFDSADLPLLSVEYLICLFSSNYHTIECKFYLAILQNWWCVAKRETTFPFNKLWPIYLPPSLWPITVKNRYTCKFWSSQKNESKKQADSSEDCRRANVCLLHRNVNEL